MVDGNLVSAVLVFWTLFVAVNIDISEFTFVFFSETVVAPIMNKSHTISHTYQIK